jgi:hypothetical protein
MCGFFVFTRLKKYGGGDVQVTGRRAEGGRIFHIWIYEKSNSFFVTTADKIWPVIIVYHYNQKQCFFLPEN